MGSVTRIDLADGTVASRGSACRTPHELALSPGGQHLAVGCYDGRTIAILNAADLSPVATIVLGEGARPHGIVWHPKGEIFASAEGRRSIFRVRDPLSSAPQIDEFPTGETGSHMVVISPAADVAWTANLGSQSVTRIDLGGGSPPRSVKTGQGTEGIVLSADGRRLWASAREEDRLVELDPETLAIRRSVTTGRFPLRVVEHPSGRWVVTSNLTDGTVSVVDTATGTVERTITVSGGAASAQVTLLFDPSGTRLYAAETQTDTIAEIDFASGRVLRRLAGGPGGDGLAIQAAGITGTAAR
ncbi:YncE family protein [Tsuneonella dongtanensis]|uniref:YncE family protein n=1 Tax=Tsuneonella dongtanensis TaxID=692370 RepID=UPI0018DC0BF4|nr:YncE family protein [Tsuneonella dongtanensis]